ncbi:MAG TPA: MarR family transcriptional regulator [Solirubrobacteraceae bacterium]|jgi:DNA-binding transcriptional regulator GbsR (MarR family)
MPALVFAALLATDSGHLTADELATQLRVSRAAVSGAVKYLTQLGLVSRTRQPGTRRHLYFVQDPTWYQLVARREQVMERWIASTRAGIEALGSDTPAGARLVESLRFFEFILEELPAMLERWEQRRNAE